MNKKWNYLLLLLAILFGSALQGCTTSYGAKPIEARVVDANTGRPLEGVIINAKWELNFGWEYGSYYDMKVMEAVTDQNGRFSFPAWGPEPIPSQLPWNARMQNGDPVMTFFKGGYIPLRLRNEREEWHRFSGPRIRTSEWNGKTIELKKFDENFKYSLPGYAAMVNGLVDSGLSYSVSGGYICDWMKTPRMLVAMLKEVDRINEQDKSHTISNTISSKYIINEFELSSLQNGCGSTKEFLKEYMK